MIKKIFIFTLLIFIFGEIFRFDLGNGIVLKPLDIGVGLTVIVWAIYKLIRKEKIKEKRILLPMSLFILMGAVSLLIGHVGLSLSQMLVSFLYLVRWVAYAGIFFLVCDFDKKSKEQIARILTVVGGLVVVFGYIQYFYYSNLRNLIYLGWDEHMYRMFSVFFDPNFAGAFFVLFFLFLSANFFKKKNLLLGMLLILTLGGVFLTFSRSALIMLVVAASLFLILKSRKKLIFLLFSIVLVVLLISSRYFNITSINLFRVASSEARIETAKDAIRIIEDHPFFGVGFNAYRYAQFRYGFRVKTSVFSHADASPDNSFLFVLATSGAVGLFFFIWMWIRTLKSNLADSALVFSSIFGVFVSSMFINSLFYTYIMFWLWIILGLNLNEDSKLKKSK